MCCWPVADTLEYSIKGVVRVGKVREKETMVLCGVCVESPVNSSDKRCQPAPRKNSLTNAPLIQSIQDECRSTYRNVFFMRQSTLLHFTQVVYQAVMSVTWTDSVLKQWRLADEHVITRCYTQKTALFTIAIWHLTLGYVTFGGFL